MSDSQKWKKKFEDVSAILYEKENLLKEYAETIKKSDLLIQEVMNKLRVELKVAHQIHRILLPVELPIIPHCEFSFKFNPADINNSKGKDFYEVCPYRSTKSFSIIMSSCASYSLSALLFSSRLKMMSQGERLDGLKPHEFIKRLVKEINKDVSHWSKKNIQTSALLQDKVSIFYAFVDQKTYKMNYCLAGDITALVQYAESGDIKVIKPVAQSLNSQEITKLKTQQIILNRQDRLILCSSGVLGCLSTKGDKYSLAQLKNTLKQESSSTVHKIRNKLFYELQAFTKGCLSQKDQTILVMEIKEMILKLAPSE